MRHLHPSDAHLQQPRAGLQGAVRDGVLVSVILWHSLHLASTTYEVNMLSMRVLLQEGTALWDVV
jgi:hypothetical protein